MKNILLIGLSLLIGLTTVLAQGRKGPRGQHKNPALKAELKAYHQKEVLPVLQAKHDEFDKKLSAEDLAFLNAKRAESKQLHVAAKALHQKTRAAHKEGKSREEVKELFGAERKKMHEDKKALAETMQPFIERNQTLITQTQEELQANRAQWRTDRKAIFEKHRPADAPTKEECTKEGKDKGAHRHHKGKHHHKRHHKGEHNPEKSAERKAMHEQRKTMRFLLWDGEAKTSGEATESIDNSSANGLGALETAITLDNYPNPATTQTTVQFELPSSAKEVTLTITTLEGKTVQQQNLGKRAAGTHKVGVDVNNLTNGQYFYSLNVDGKKLSKTLMVNR